MEWKGCRVLVTGAGGFIASHLVERLVELKARVKAFVRYNSRNDFGLLELLPVHIKEKLEIICGDLCDQEFVRNSLKDIELVFHLAAVIAIPYSYQSPRHVVENNVISTLNVLEAALENKITKLVHTSSSEVYGSAQYSPIDENHPLQAQSPYAASKIAADKLAQSFYFSYELPVVIIRPFNTYGPRQSARAIIPTIITQALCRDQILLGAMEPTRDFTFIDDLIEAFLKVAQCEDANGEVFNIGTGEEVSIGDVAETVLKLIEKKTPIIFDASRIRPLTSEVQKLVCDATRARKELGWQPRVPLEDGLKKTIRWYEEYMHRYKPEIYNI